MAQASQTANWQAQHDDRAGTRSKYHQVGTSEPRSSRGSSPHHRYYSYLSSSQNANLLAFSLVAFTILTTQDGPAPARLADDPRFAAKSPTLITRVNAVPEAVLNAFHPPAVINATGA